jgi:hypothetical protein
MNVAGSNPSGREELWREYRVAFQEFSRAVRKIQIPRANVTPDAAATNASLLELERSRLRYGRSRDALACALLQPSHPNRASLCDSPRNDEGHVRRIAELLWEFDDRRDGRADENWRRAEEIVRSAMAT